MSDKGPRTAVEIAMERLRQKDAEDGVAAPARTDEQKNAITEIRSVFDAKLAHAEVMHRSAIAGVFDPEVRAKLDEEYQRDRARFVSERDAKIEKIRGGS